MNKTLVIMAAGMGSRYGGLKQIDPVGPGGEIIIDYSIFDAINAGFNKVVFIIKKENLEAFKEVVGDKISDKVEVKYVFQELSKLPEGFNCPKERTKPWGTGHAVLCCKDEVKEPFMVINADDFYGRGCFTAISEWIDKTDFTVRPYRFSMAGFYLRNTLTENGTVSRGVCEVNSDGKLVDVVERTKIMRHCKKIAFTEDGESWTELPEDVHASMNCWCFPAEFISEMEQYFKDFLKDALVNNPLKGEFYLPFAVRDMLLEKKCTVDVLPTADKWFGVTYIEDKPDVEKAVAELHREGVYPERLW